MLCASWATVRRDRSALQPEARARSRARPGRCPGAAPTTAILARSRSASATASPSRTVGRHRPATRSRSGPARARSRGSSRRRTACAGRWARSAGSAPCGAPTPARAARPAAPARPRPSAPGRAGTARGRAAPAGRRAARRAIAPRSPRPCQVAALQEAIVSASRASTPRSTARRTIELTWPSRAMCAGSRSSVQNAIRPGPNSSHQRQQRVQVAGARRLADQQPHARPQPLAALLRAWSPRGPIRSRRRRRPAAGGRARPGRGRRRAPLPPGPASRARPDRRRSRPGSSSSRPGPARCRRRSRPSRSPVVSARRGDSNRDAGTHDGAMKNTSSGRSAQASASQCTPSVPSTFAISWGSATTDGGAERQHQLRELVHQQQRGLEVQVRIDQAGDDVSPACVERLAAAVLPDAGDPAVAHGHVGLQPLAGVHRQHPAAPHDQVGGLVAACHRQPSGEVGHGRASLRVFYSEYSQRARIIALADRVSVP